MREKNQHLVWIFAHVSLTPDIRLDGEGVVRKALWRSPLDGELGPSMGSVGVTSHQPAQAEVCDLHDMIFSDQAVPCRKIPERKRGNQGGKEREVRLLWHMRWTNLQERLERGTSRQSPYLCMKFFFSRYSMAEEIWVAMYSSTTAFTSSLSQSLK